MQIVNETTELEVGKFYYVRCAKFVLNSSVIDYIPIIGEPHLDKQLGIDWKHIHIDGRFDNKYTALDKFGRTNTILQIGKQNTLYPYVEEIVIKKKKCKRLTTGINPPFRNTTTPLGRQVGEKYWSFYDSYVGKSCKGKKCPHLGATMMDMGKGFLVCPLHNLHGCPTKEVIVKI